MPQVGMFLYIQVFKSLGSESLGPGDLSTSFTIDVASTEAGFFTDGGAGSLTCGGAAEGKAQVMNDGRFQFCDGNATSVLRTLVPSALWSGGATQTTGGAVTLDAESVEDLAGAMDDGTETRISFTYNDGNGNFDLVVDDMNDDIPESGDFGNADDLEASGELSANVVDESKIADDAIQEEHLKAVNAAADEDIVTYESTTGDFEYHTPAELISAGTEISWSGTTLNVTAHTTDTNAETKCTGTTTYLDGENNCDDISGVYENELDDSAGLLAALSDETGTGLAVFGTTPTIATPVLTGKIDRNNVAVNDDDCTGEQGIWWYDTTDSAFEFCNANSGTPIELGGTETNDLESVATSAGSNEIFVGSGVDAGTYIGIAACAADEKLEYTDGSPNTFTCEAIGSLVDADIEDALTISSSGDVDGNAVNQQEMELGINVQTGTTYTLVITDQSKLVTMSNSSSNTLTIPLNSAVAFPTGTVVCVQQLGTGTTTIVSSSGASVNGTDPGSEALIAQYGELCFTKHATDTWYTASVSAAVDLTSEVAGSLPIANGGTALTANPVRSEWFGADRLVSDGTQCLDHVLVIIGSWGEQPTIICADNDASIMTGTHMMPDGWDAGTVTFEIVYIQDAADTGVLNADVSGRCVGTGETPQAYGSEVAIDDAAVTGTDAMDATTSAAVTLAGTCAAGDLVQFQVALDATGTTTAVATLNFVGVKMEYSTTYSDN